MQKTIYYSLISATLIIIIITICYIYLFQKNNKESSLHVHLEHTKLSTTTLNSIGAISPVGKAGGVDPLAIAKNMTTDMSLSTLKRERAKIFYARNISESTPVGQSDERRLTFTDSYTSLYEVAKYSTDTFNRVKAYTSMSYLYLESCSLDDWLIYSIKPVMQEEEYKNFESASYGSRDVLVSRILLHFNLEANKLGDDRFVKILVASEYLRLAERSKKYITKNEYSDLLTLASKYIAESEKAPDVIAVAEFDKIESKRRTLMVKTKLSLENKLANSKDLERELEDAINESNLLHLRLGAGAYNTENNLRYIYASYLWGKGKDANLTKIKEILAPIFTKEYEENAAGWVYGISLKENSPQFADLKEMAKVYPELKDFLMRHNWKFN